MGADGPSARRIRLVTRRAIAVEERPGGGLRARDIRLASHRGNEPSNPRVAVRSLATRAQPPRRGRRPGVRLPGAARSPTPITATGYRRRSRLPRMTPVNVSAAYPAPTTADSPTGVLICVRRRRRRHGGGRAQPVRTRVGDLRGERRLADHRLGLGPRRRLRRLRGRRRQRRAPQPGGDARLRGAARLPVAQGSRATSRPRSSARSSARCSSTSSTRGRSTRTSARTTSRAAIPTR